MKKCIMCGRDDMVVVIDDVRYEFPEGTFVEPCEMTQCQGCNEGYYSGTDLGEVELRVRERLIRIDAKSKQALKFIRNAKH